MKLKAIYQSNRTMYRSLKQNIWLIPEIKGIKREDTKAYSDLTLREIITNHLLYTETTEKCIDQ